uniref:50S ribosomal protein L22, chloroplastic n=1 Tax=Oryza glumipatula TaxID=40148 RepID=A0A0E0AI04_9ORYZ
MAGLMVASSGDMFMPAKKWAKGICEKNTNRSSTSSNGFSKHKNTSISVFKVQRVLHEMRYYEETIMILNLMPDLVLKLVYSATANTSRYRDFDKANLFIKPK